MNTVIIPINFSDTSLNAARYTVKLFTEQPQVNIILYHMFHKVDDEANAVEKLEVLKNDITKNRTVTANINILTEKGSDFIEELQKLARHREANLIVMGVKERSSLAKVFTSSNALKMVETKVCPVLIIPPNAEYKEVKNVMLTSDFKNVVSTTPSVPIKNILKTFHPRLHILNVNSELYIALTEDYELEKAKLNEMFSEFNPEFYFLRLYDVNEAVEMFAKDKNIDLIIIVQKENLILNKYFGTSHTKHLAYQSSMPVLIAHE